MTRHEYWTIIDELDWKGRCERKDYRPYETIGDIIADEYPYNISELQEITREERDSITKFLSSNGIRTGNDSGWDLTAHIIGCGFDFVEFVRDKVNSGEYTFDNIYSEIPYIENFQYSFSKAYESLCAKENLESSSSNKEEVYKEWLKGKIREENIKTLID